MNQPINVGDLIELKIKRMGINGEGIGYYQKLAIFVDYALPDEDVKVEITNIYENRAEGKIVDVITPHQDRVEPFCKIYYECGGCQTQHVSYENTLLMKRDLILQAFDRYISPKVKLSTVKETIGADDPTFYRNKASLPVQKIKNKNYVGMYRKNSNHFVKLESCPIQHKLINHILKTIIDLMDEMGVDGYNQKLRRGYVRSLVVRVSEHFNEAQVSFIMLRKSNRLEELVKKLIIKEPKIVSVYEVMNADLKKPGYFTEDIKKLYGKDTIIEKLHGFDFVLKPEAFFQLNTEQADKFYLEMKRLANLKPHEIAIDAYAGTAPVSHYIYQEAKHVYAIEIDEMSVESARVSLKENNITNVTVLKNDFKKALVSLKDKKIDVMFFDPPRTGLGEDTIDVILKFMPKRIIYGSCNPSTLAKDLNTLLKHYDLVETVPLDMFPYTSLVESVSLLELKNYK
ncbi:MAG: 23S rRNA (uracil(1939)-C(5))-methyltransferase RlmD [Tenericutes bacterium HGW-Tenericutes-6]|nr:MAG: 23S rRNA (uracil(1939)-C(5))-methyltransferase RlmD [Tenericutes bacterium HGW-Tenericutes-6]